MSTQAQIAANQANAQLSTGPASEEGKAISSRNRTSHGLCYDGTLFFLLPWESADAYNTLRIELLDEYRPMSRTEEILVERMSQHHWLRNRAEFLQGRCFAEDGSVNEKRLALYLRYQTTHERAFHKCLNDLLKLRAETRKVEIGFESQKRVQEKHELSKERQKLQIFLAELKLDGERRRDSSRNLNQAERLTAPQEAKQAA